MLHRNSAGVTQTTPQNSKNTPFDPIDVDSLLLPASTTTFGQGLTSFTKLSNTQLHPRINGFEVIHSRGINNNLQSGVTEEHNCCNSNIYNSAHQSEFVNRSIQHRLDVSSLDDILEMATDHRTTNEWRSSFQSVRDKFSSAVVTEEAEKSPFPHIRMYTSQTLPRKLSNGVHPQSAPLSKSSSECDVLHSADLSIQPNAPSILSTAIDRKQVQSILDKQQYRKYNMSSFWEKTLNKPRIGSWLAAAGLEDVPKTQLETFKIQPHKRKSPSPVFRSSPVRNGSSLHFDELNDIVAESSTLDRPRRKSSMDASFPANRTPFLGESFTQTAKSSIGSVSSVDITSRNSKGSTSQGQLISNGPLNYQSKNTKQTQLLNFVNLDSTLTELDKKPPITTFTMANSKPESTELTSVTPISTPIVKIGRCTSDSPSPDTTSMTSDSGPTGLPHPKPKHHLREQLLSAGIEPRSPTFPRISVHAFPVPLTGSVAARISEIERRPSSNAPANLQIAGHGSMSPPPLSPRQALSQPTVYRTKPIIHMLTEPASTKSPLTFDQQDVFTFPIPKPLNKCVESLESGPRRLVEPCGSQQYSSAAPSAALVKVLSPSSSHLPPHGNRSHSHFIQQRSSAARLNIPRQHVPKFHFPMGKPAAASENESTLRRAQMIFQRLQGCLSMANMGDLMQALRLPLYWKRPLFNAISHTCNNAIQTPITFQDFSRWWNTMVVTAHDEASRFIYTLTGGSRQYLERADFEPMLFDLIDTFPGLHFLREAKEFHSRYVQTVTVRIFHSINRSWSGKINASELRLSNFLQTVRSLEETDDINTVTDYFSYEHFYVIYCKFWELDRDHDLIIDKADMARHANSAIPQRVIERIFSGAVCRIKGNRDRMGYTDFVAFLLAEEDKRHPTSIEYWFRCLDLDGDGLLSLYELEYFYEDVARKMDSSGIEALKFNDVACQLLDMVRPILRDKVQLSDLKRSSTMATRFFNAFVNVHKYYEQEAADGERATVKTDTDEEMSEWDRFCAEEYELLMQEEQQDELELTCDIGSDEESSLTTRSSSESQLRRSPLTDTL